MLPLGWVKKKNQNFFLFLFSFAGICVICEYDIYLGEEMMIKGMKLIRTRRTLVHEVHRPRGQNEQGGLKKKYIKI